MLVSDIMTKDVITISQDSSLQEAAGILAKLRIHGMPVVDEQKKVVGIITESDFFVKDSSNIFLPTFLEFVRGEKKPAEGEERGRADLEKKTKVRDIMTDGCVTVSPNMSLDELILLIKDKNFNTIPVVDADQKLVGVVTIIDVVRLL